MKINEVLRHGEITLIEAEIEEGKLKAKLLLLAVLNITKEEYAVLQNEEIDDDSEIRYKGKIEELKQGRPLEYIIGKAYFLGDEYIVNENVLIPRLETELVVNKALDLIKNHGIKKVLEIGSGSGVIGIHLVKNSDISLVAVDISDKAIETACKNASRLNVDFSRYEVIKSDVYENIGEKFDLIISNPPYVKTSEMETLNKDVLNEPHLALDGGVDGLDLYRKIIENAFNYINGYGSFLILEIGATLAEDVVQILEENNWKSNEVFTDFSGLNRMIISEI